MSFVEYYASIKVNEFSRTTISLFCALVMTSIHEKHLSYNSGADLGGVSDAPIPPQGFDPLPTQRAPFVLLW